MKKFKLKLLYWILGVKKDWHDMEDEKEWLAEQWEKRGFKSYLVYRDLSILKEIGEGVSWNRYNYLLGRRKEILSLGAEAKKLFDIQDKPKKQ